MAKVGELVQVAMMFKGKEVQPHAFLWQGHRYDVEHIYLIHKTRIGEALRWHFTVATLGGATAKLVFDTLSLSWQLESIE